MLYLVLVAVAIILCVSLFLRAQVRSACFLKVAVPLDLSTINFIVSTATEEIPTWANPISIGNLFNGPLTGMDVRYTARLRAKYGPILGFRIGSTNYIIAQDPEVATEIFVKNGFKCIGRQSNPFSDVLSGLTNAPDGQPTGIVFSIGDRWRENRKFALMKVFGKDRIPKLQEKMAEEIRVFLDWIDSQISPASNSMNLEPSRDISALTMNVIGAIACDLRPSSLYGNSNTDDSTTRLSSGIFHILSLTVTAGAATMLNMLVPLARRMETFGYPQWKERAEETRRLLKNVIEQREAEVSQIGLPENPTILDLLVQSRLQDPEFAAVQTGDIIGILLDFFLAGTDTTSLTLSWLLPELVNHPDVKSRLVEEIDNVVGRDRPAQTQDFSNMPVLDAVVNETLRRYPAVPAGLPHLVEEPFQVCDGKYEIPVGALTRVNIYALHHEPSIFPDPLKWNPQRWIDDPQLRNSPWFVPFQLGPRICLGRFLSLAEMKAIVVSLLQRFDLGASTVDGKIELTESDYKVLNKPQKPYSIKITRRM